MANDQNLIQSINEQRANKEKSTTRRLASGQVRRQRADLKRAFETL
nr:hypothetical protein [Streptococcus equi]